MKLTNKRGDVFGMPFTMIFSIFLIAIFIFTAFFAIKHFLNIQKDVEVGTFLNDFQQEIDDAWKSQSSSSTFSSNLPDKITDVCFANLNEDLSSGGREIEIYSELKKNAVYANNFFFYPSRYASIPSAIIQHVNATGLSNPYCIPNNKGKISIKLEKGFFDSLVRVGR